MQGLPTYLDTVAIEFYKKNSKNKNLSLSIHFNNFIFMLIYVK